MKVKEVDGNTALVELTGQEVCSIANTMMPVIRRTTDVVPSDPIEAIARDMAKLGLWMCWLTVHGGKGIIADDEGELSVKEPT